MSKPCQNLPFDVDAIVSPEEQLQQVANEIDAAALPTAALQLAADRLGETHVGVAHHQLDAQRASLCCSNLWQVRTVWAHGVRSFRAKPRSIARCCVPSKC